MGTKRTYDEVEAVHSSRRTQIYGETSNAAKKPRKTGPPVPRKQVHASSVNAIKKRIRDVTRRLDRADNLPANIRVEDERALAAYEQELAAAHEQGVRQKMIKKYHRVRFFERKKADRQVKGFRKQLLQDPTTENIEKIKARLHVAEVDLNYTLYCPLSEVYIGLYAKDAGKEQGVEDDEDNDDDDIQRKRPPMWAEIERRMKDGGLEDFRNRRNFSLVSRPKPQKAKLKVDRKPPPVNVQSKREKPPSRERLNRRERRNKLLGAERKVAEIETNKEEDVALSDGGFFEE